MTSAKIILGLVSFCVGILLCEGLLSWIKPQVYRRPQVWQFDRELGWKHIPLASGWQVKPEFEVEFRINADGLRDGEYQREKTPQSRRILAFGDSFAEGWGVQLEESVSKQLEGRLRKTAPEVDTEVINFGVAGYGTDQELLFFEKLGRLYEPDLVLVFFYPNDLWNNGKRRGMGAERGYKPFFRLGRDNHLRLFGVPVRKTPFWDENARASRPFFERLDHYLGQRWHLYVLFEKAMAPEIPKGQQQMFYEGLYGTRDDPKLAQLWELTGRLLQAFHSSARQAGAEMVLVYVPTIVQIDAENWRMKRGLHGLIETFDLQKPNRQIAHFASRYDISLVDLYEPFKRAAQHQQLYYQESHWNAQGHALAAALIGDYLIRQERAMGTEDLQAGVRGE